jgi:hypothetical protein
LWLAISDPQGHAFGHVGVVKPLGRFEKPRLFLVAKAARRHDR